MKTTLSAVLSCAALVAGCAHPVERKSFVAEHRNVPHTDVVLTSGATNRCGPLRLHHVERDGLCQFYYDFPPATLTTARRGEQILGPMPDFCAAVLRADYKRGRAIIRHYAPAHQH